MNRLQKDAVLCELADRMKEQGSWCGETHLQKATYFLQELRTVPLDFGYVLYKHGPFSFDLRDELTAMRADGFIDLAERGPYGPSLMPTRLSAELRKDYPRTLGKYAADIEYVAASLGNSNVAELEKLATALYVYFENSGRSALIRARVLHDLKPHISFADSLDAVKRVDAIVERSE